MSAILLIAPAVTIYFGYFHDAMIVILAIGIVLKCIGQERYLEGIRNTAIYNAMITSSVVLGVFGMRLIGEVVDIDLLMKNVFGDKIFISAYVCLVVSNIYIDFKYNITERKLLKPENV
jgi:hypothetical protein